MPSHAPSTTPPTPPDATAGPEVGRVQRHRYPWDQWMEPGSGPYLISPDRLELRHLAGVLRTRSARRGVPVRLRRVAEGLLFQFGPPFSPALADVEVVRVPGDAPPACPTCRQKWPPNLETKTARTKETNGQPEAAEAAAATA